MFLILLKGFTLTLTMIIPIGSQNAMLLTQGINKNHHIKTAGLFIIYDAILISIGVLGGSLILSSNELLYSFLTWGGISFLLIYGAMSLKNAWFCDTTGSEITRVNKSFYIVFITSLIVTFLNPHAYIDTVMVIGSVGGQYSGIDKYYFLFGAIFGSIFWFTALATSAAKLSKALSKPKVRRCIDTTIGLMMWFIAWTLFKTA
ncbi:MAG: LysE/ArgO family amino acid transporter [Colwellia sp.]